MVKRSLQASDTGIIAVKKAIQRKGWTQDYLAAQAGLSTRNSVWKFASGRAVDRQIFMELCFQLDLDWQEIAALPVASPSPETAGDSDIDTLVKNARSLLKDYIQGRCARVRACLEVTTPPLLKSVYTELRALPYLSHQRWLEVADLQGGGTNDEPFRFDRGERKTLSIEDVVAPHAKVLILGKPGSGKTTFLQYLALQCLEGRYGGDRVPVLISLRALAIDGENAGDFRLLSYIQSVWSRHDISPEQTETLLREGRVLVLLDGLDEIPGVHGEEIIQQIQQFTERFDRGQTILTCRLAAQTYHFFGFTYVELADFDGEQIETFARRWFTAGIPAAGGRAKATRFLDLLKRPENQAIRELASTPILLNLICLVFQERANFPTKRSKLYQEGLEILLAKWDRSRGIKRDTLYRDLSLADKLKLLSEIAAITFERGNYFFEKSEVLAIITDYLVRLPNANFDPDCLGSDTEKILEAIEVQHGLLLERAKGVYSFSHVTFQEYLTARKIVGSLDPDTLDRSLTELANRVTDNRWREIILLAIGMLPDANKLLPKIETAIVSLVDGRPKLQDLIDCIERKARSVSSPYDPLAIRAFYFSLFFNQDYAWAISLDSRLVNNLSGDLALDIALSRTLMKAVILLENPTVDRVIDLGFALDIERGFSLDPEFARSLQTLKRGLPNLSAGKEFLQAWWRENGSFWVENFRNILIEKRSIGQDWNFSSIERDVLARYYWANQLLVECRRSR